jgi:glycosyltransferase involved in cell wall biosynthesis
MVAVNAAQMGDIVLGSCRTLCRKIKTIGRRIYRRLLPYSEVAISTARWSKPDGAEKDVTVVGYLSAATGVGEVGRQTLLALRASSLTVEGCDVALNVLATRNDNSCDDLLVATSTSPVQIFNVNADQLPLVRAHLTPRLRPDAKRICIPFWELSRYPDIWLTALRAMDEVWAPSRFIAKSLQKELGEKTLYMPVALEFVVPEPLPRAKYNLPSDRFLFFFAFDFLSFVERKNPRATIAAFRMAFPKYGRAGLVLKCVNGAAAADRFSNFREEFAGDPDIFLIDETLTRSDTLALIASMDAVISLHRSEGFGLLIGEAMLLGKPVIATDYSASQDLLSPLTGYPVKFDLIPVRSGQYPFAEGQMWADPDVEHAAVLMKNLCEDPAQSMILVRQARNHMRANFSYKNVGLAQAERIRGVQR